MSPNNAKGPICRVLHNIPNLFPRSNSKTMREAFHAHVVGGGCDDIQDGGRKLIPTTHHPPHEHEKLPHYYYTAKQIHIKHTTLISKQIYLTTPFHFLPLSFVFNLYPCLKKSWDSLSKWQLKPCISIPYRITMLNIMPYAAFNSTFNTTDFDYKIWHLST